MSPPFKKIRCKWYNDSGHPRVNPAKLEQDALDPTGCRFAAWKCCFVHPEDPTWDSAQRTKPPMAHEYPGNQVPRTPSPFGRIRRTRSPEPRIKYEPQSPRLPRNGRSSDRSRTLSQEFRRDSLLDRVDNRPPPSPYPLARGKSAERVWEANKGHRTPRDFSRDRINSDREEGFISDRERTESNNDWDRASDRGSERSREFIRSPVRRNSKATRPIFSVKPISLDGRGQGHKRTASGDRKGSASPSLLERMASAPRQPRALNRAIDRNPLPPSNPPPSNPPPPPRPPFSPSRPSSRSNSNSFTTAGPPPESTMPSARSSMPPPPTPVSVTSAVTTFPPALPPKPAFLNPPNDSVKKESLTREERRKLWGERIELLFEAGAAKRAYTDCATDVKEKQIFTSSERTERLSDAARESIARSLQAADAKRETARLRSLSTHQKLLELDFWPVRRRPELTELVMREEEEHVIEDGHAEVKKQASELGDALSRVDRQLKEVTQFVASRSKSNAVPTSTSMDWEPTDVTARATKRRKVGEDGAYTSDSGSTTLGRASLSPAASASAAIARQNRQIRKRLTKLESDFHELENLYIQSEHDAQEELASQVDHYVDTRREEFVKCAKAEPLPRVTRLEKNIEQLDKEVKVIIVELTDLVGAEEEMREVMNNLVEEQARAKAEGARVRAATVKSIFRGRDLQEQLEAQLKEWETVNARLASLEKERERENIHSSSHLPSPESPSSDPSLSLPPAHTPTLRHLATLLFPHVLYAIRTKFVVPHLVETKEGVVQIIREQLHENLPQEVELVREKVEKITKAPEVIALLQSAGMFSTNGVGVGSGEGGHAGLNGTHTQVNGKGKGTSNPTTNSPPIP